MARISDSGNPGPPGSDPPPTRAPELSAPGGTALYVHLPYCVAKCTYCDFFSVAPTDDRELTDIVDTILLEAGSRAPRAPRTVFLGGGTPSMLGEEDLARLLDGLEERTGFRSSTEEVTLECNPESLTRSKAERLLALGVDRLSIGFQSLEPRILELFGRVHTPDDSFAAFGAARDAGCKRLSVDLIYAVPGQKLEDWERDLGRVLDLGPDHVSAYSLAFEEGTALTQALHKGALSKLEEALDLSFFLRTREILEERGYGAYEISNFAPIGQHCRHNEMYWDNGDYVGLGPGAVSSLGGTRFGSPRSVPLWRKSLLEDRFPASWEETLEPTQRLGETWWLGLRTARGVDPSEARDTALAGALPSESFASPDPAESLARTLGTEGFLEQRGTRWCLTKRGLPLADAVSRRFLDALG